MCRDCVERRELGDEDSKPVSFFCQVCKKICKFAVVECSLCKEVRHLECLKVPLKFLFASGSQGCANLGDLEFN